MAEEKNAKNSAGASDENTKNYVSRCIGVFLGEESEFPIRFVISLTVSEILADYCSKGQKDVLFSQGMPTRMEKLCKQVNSGTFE